MELSSTTIKLFRELGFELDNELGRFYHPDLPFHFAVRGDYLDVWVNMDEYKISSGKIPVNVVSLRRLIEAFNPQKSGA